MASWTDKIAVETTLKFRDLFNIKEFIETGTYTGVNAKFYSDKFQYVRSCEKMMDSLEIAIVRIGKINNVTLYLKSSPDFLKQYIKRYKEEGRTDIVFFYLDAHFFDKNLPKKDRFLVKNELKALKGFKNCVIAIHDFNNGIFNGLNYEGQLLDINIVKKDLMNINPDFKLYTNTKCDIVTAEEIKTGKIPLLDWNSEMEKTMNFVWSNPIKTYRGILYASPYDLDLNKWDLIKHDN